MKDTRTRQWGIWLHVPLDR